MEVGKFFVCKWTNGLAFGDEQFNKFDPFPATTASAHAAPLILEDGKEYVFDSSSSMVAGTMDVAGHVAGIAGKMKARMQVSNGGNTLTVKFENIKFAEYVGPFDSPNSWPFDGLNVSSCTTRFDRRVHEQI